MSVAASRIAATAPFLALALALGPLPAFAQGSDVSAEAEAMIEEILDEKRAWVEEVEAEDYFFWSRYLRRVDAGGADFPSPPGFYGVTDLVIGGDGAPLPRATEDERTIPEEAWEAAAEWAFARETEALLVMRNGVIEYERYGEDYGPGSLLAVRSFTKLLPSLLTGTAIRDGHIESLDDPIGKYIEELEGRPAGDIPIRSLQTWSSGMELYGRVDEPYNLMQRLAEGQNVNEVALQFKADAEPDSRFALTQVDHQLAGMVIERATGMPFADYLSEAVWAPMGLGTATLNLDSPTGNVRTFCCMQARAVDWLKIGQMINDGGEWDGQQIIPADYVAEMKQPSVANPYMGLSLWIGWKPGEEEETEGGAGRFPLQLPHSEPYRVDDVFYLIGGGTIHLWMVPSLDLVMMRWGRDVRDWDVAKIPNTILDGILEE